MNIITGMHRSGTSLVARLFYEVGADMGDPDTFYRPDRWNPEGYYEQPDIHAINMPLINGMWWKFAYFNLPATRTIMRRARRMETQIRETAHAYEGRVIKETRFCLTLPAWLKYGANVQHVLICLREPVQVARSIQKRNSTTLRHGYNLWYAHNTRILEHAHDLPVWFILYNDLLDPTTYPREMRAAFRFFEMDVDDAQLAEVRTKAVRENMNHNPETLDAYPGKIGELWNELRQRHAAQFK